MTVICGGIIGVGQAWQLCNRTHEICRTFAHTSRRIPHDQLRSLRTVHPHCDRQHFRKTAIYAAAEGSSADGDDKWFALLPESSSALYMCSLPSIEAWLRSLGFTQSGVRPEIWTVERDDWHAELSMEVTEVSIR